MGELTVIKNPFNPSDGRILSFVEENSSIRSIFEKYSNDEFDLVISVNGKICEDLNYIVKAGDRVQVMSKIKGGGGGGGGGSKNVLRMVAMVIVVAVTSYFTMGAGASTGAAWISSMSVTTVAPGSLAMTVIGATAVAAGMMLVNAVLPPPTPSVKPVSYESLQDSNTYGWDGQRNQLNEGLTAPILYGKMRVAPQIIAQRRDYTENKDLLNVLMLVSEGRCDAATPVVTVSGRPTSDFSNISMEYKRGEISQTPLQNSFNDIIFQKSVNVILDPDVEGGNNGTLTVTTDGNAVEKLAVGISLPGGLFSYSEGEYKWRDVGITVEFRVAGSSGPWTPFSGMKSRILWQSYEQQFVQVGTRPGVVNGDNDLNDTEYPVFTYIWTFVEKDRDYNDPAFYFINKSPDTIRARFEHDAVLPPNQYEIRVTKLLHTKALEGTTSHSQQLRFDYIDEIVGEELSYPGRCVLAVNAVAQQEIYGQSPVFQVIADRGELELYAGEWGKSTPVTGRQSSNPAWACYDLLTNPLYGGRVNPADIVEQEFIDWAAFCDSENLKIGIYLDQNITMQEALTKISQVGRGSVLQRGTKYGAIWDTVSPMVYLFGMGQIIEGTFNMTYLERDNRANVVEITYYDEDLDYERKVFELRSDNGSDPALDRKASINLLGVTNRAQAARHAQFLLRSNEYLIRTVSFQADVESIHCQVGDVIGVSHDVPQYGYSGRVMSSTSNTVTFDRAVTLSAGTNSVIIKHLDDSLETVEVVEANGDFSTVTLATGTWTQNPEYMSVYTIGLVNYETKLFRVMAIRKSQEFQAEIIAMEYNPLVYNLDAVIPDYEPNNGLPSVTNLRVTQNFARLSDGSYQGLLDVTWDGFSTEWKVQIWNETLNKTTPQWNSDVSERRFTTPALSVGSESTYRVRVTGLDGKYEETSVPFIIDSPEPVVDLRSKTLDNFVFLNWEQPISELGVDYYEIYEGLDFLTSKMITTTTSTNWNTYEPVTGLHVYHVVAVNLAGMRSEPVSVPVNIFSNSDYVGVTELTVDGSGSQSDVYWDGQQLIGPYLEASSTWDDVWQANYPSLYTTKTWGDWINDKDVTTFMSALGASGATVGSYSQTWDLGSVYPSSIKLDVSMNQSSVLGSRNAAHVDYELEISSDGVKYYPFSNVETLQVTGVRYVRLSLDFQGNGDGAIGVMPSIKITTKELSQSGQEDIDDLITGTTIPLTKGFHDVQSITITPKGTSALIGVYDFNDVPNPTSFTVFLFDKDGNSVFGDFSYTVKGF